MRSQLLSLLRDSSALVLAGALLWAPDGRTATLPNLYRVTVVPDPAASDQRTAAIEAAMARLLIRVTGNRGAPLDPALQHIVADASRYLNSYGLDRQGQAQVGFIPSQVEQALTALGMPLWGAERPLALLWVAVDDGLGGRALLGANETTDPGGELTPATQTMLADLRKELLAVADERGLPVTLPLLDIEDLNAVTFADVWGGFDDRVAAASRRYGADAILIGRMRPGLLGNEVQWLLVTGGTRRALEGAAIRDGLDAVADSFAAELTTVGGASTAAITVLNVASSADYDRVMSYLERQSVLETVDVESLERGVLSLRVAARGDARVLGRVLSLGDVLRPAAAVGSGGSLVFEIARSGIAQ
jgi:hypothetical protein